MHAQSLLAEKVLGVANEFGAYMVVVFSIPTSRIKFLSLVNNTQNIAFQRQRKFNNIMCCGGAFEVPW